MKQKLLSAIAALFMVCNMAFSQPDSAKNKEGKITQLTVMVVPRTNEDQDVCTVLDQSEAKRIAVSQIKEAFDKRGFRTIDFVARLNASKTNQAFMSANARDAKAMIIQTSATDLLVEADVIVSAYSGNASIARASVQCYDASSALTLGISSGDKRKSPPNTADVISLVSRALGDECLQNFLASLEAGWENIRTNGRSLKLNVGPSSSGQVNLFSKPKASTKNITALVTDWLEDHTVNSNYIINGSTKVLLDVDDVRVPVVDKRNKNYRPLFFGNDLVSFLDSNGINAESEVKNGTIYITLTSIK